MKSKDKKGILNVINDEKSVSLEWKHKKKS